MPSFVIAEKCDGCKALDTTACQHICPNDLMVLNTDSMKAYNQEPAMCWECYSCVKICPTQAIEVRGYADFAPLGHSVRVDRDEEKGVIAWRIKFRNGKKDLNLLAPITTKPWGSGTPQLKDVEGPTQEMRDSELLYNEPKYIRFDDGGLHTLESNGLEMKKGVYY